MMNAHEANKMSHENTWLLREIKEKIQSAASSGYFTAEVVPCVGKEERDRCLKELEAKGFEVKTIKDRGNFDLLLISWKNPQPANKDGMCPSHGSQFANSCGLCEYEGNLEIE